MSAPPLVAASDRKESGLEYLRKIVAGDYAQVPIGVALGFRIAAAEPGSVTLRGTPGARSYNLVNTVHGGWTAAILDTAMALSALTQMPDDQSFTTIDIRINFLRAMTAETGEVAAVGRVIQLGRRIAYCEASLADSAGKLLAHGTGSCLVVPRG
jgi:uncharacterized protein (TIGR00369 family)